MTVTLENDLFSADGEFAVGDLMNVDFYKFSDTVADDYICDLCMCNELFYTFIQQVLAVERFLHSKNADMLKINVGSCSIGTVYTALSAAERAGVRVQFSAAAMALAELKDLLKCFAFYWGGAAYLFLKAVASKRSGEVDRSYDRFSLVRLNQEYGKYGFLREDPSIYFLYENVMSTLASNKNIRSEDIIYSKFGFGEKLGWLFSALAGGSRLNREIKKFLTLKLNSYAAKSARSFYAKRSVHTAFYGRMLDRLFSMFQGKECITGKVMDRYGFLEVEYGKKYNIKLINYPHGIEYGFKEPRGFIGDKFHATSQHAADFFNRLYDTDKYVFDSSVMDAMLNRHHKKQGGKQVVFFSEAHEPEVNLEIINGLCSVFEKHGIKLVLKPHPKENTAFYRNVADKITITTDFDASITGNYCIARRSTVLVEALYNDSESFALLTNVSDYSIYMNYPSLQDSRIPAFESPEKLAEHVAALLSSENA